MSNNDGIQNVVDDDGSNALVGQIASALKGVLQQNTVLPDFSRENPSFSGHSGVTTVVIEILRGFKSLQKTSRID